MTLQVVFVVISSSPLARDGIHAGTRTARAGILHPAVPFFVVFALCFIVALLCSRHVRRVKRVRFRGRESLSPEAFFDEFYGDSGLDPISVAAAMREVCASFEVPAGLLRPSDRFDRELVRAGAWDYGDGVADLVLCVQAMAKRQGVAVDLQSIRTVDEFVRVYCRLSRTRPKLDAKDRSI